MRRRPERLAEGEQNREISPKYLTYEHVFAILIPTAAFSFRRPWRRGKTAPVQQSLQRGGGHMPQDKWSAVTLCPYYRKHTEVTISCEGPANQSRLTLEFASRAQREHYQEKTCACYLYRACPWPWPRPANMMMAAISGNPTADPSPAASCRRRPRRVRCSGNRFKNNARFPHS